MSKTKIIVYALILITILSVSINVYQWNTNNLLSQQTDKFVTKEVMSNLLTQVQLDVNAKLEVLDSNLQSACQQLSTTGLNGNQARSVLSDLVAKNSLIVNAATADVNDVLVAVEPGEYSNIEGIDIKQQEQNVRLHESMRSAMSDMIPLVEGFPGVVMVAPIFDVNDKLIGTLSIVIQPYNLIKSVVEPAIDSTPYSMWAMQTNGTLIYDPDPAQQSHNLFTDPLYVDYPEVQTFAQHACDEKAGYGTYRYYNTNIDDSSKQMVDKQAYWTTIGIYGAEWRLVITS